MPHLHLHLHVYVYWHVHGMVKEQNDERRKEPRSMSRSLPTSQTHCLYLQRAYWSLFLFDDDDDDLLYEHFVVLVLNIVKIPSPMINHDIVIYVITSCRWSTSRYREKL